MALLFMDGFEGNDAQYKWTQKSGNQNTPGRFSFTNSAAWTVGGAMYKSIPSTSQITVGFGFQSTDTGGGILLGVASNSGADGQVTIRISSGSTSVLELYVGGSNVASGTTVLSMNNTWYYIELQATIASSGGTAKVRLNGASSNEISFTGNTQNNSPYTSVDMVLFRTDQVSGSGGPQFVIDDVYMADGTTSHNNTFLGDARVYPLSPNGAGASTQFTPSSGSNYSDVNALPVQSSTYVYDSTSGQVDLYTLSSLVSGVGTVLGVQNNVYMAKDNAGAVSGKGMIRTGSTNYSGASQSLSSSYVTYSDMYDVNPNTSVAWTTTDISTLQAGVGVV